MSARPTAPARAIVHQREFLADTLTPLAVYHRLAAISPIRFMLESVTGGEQVSRFSFLGAGPRELYRLFPDRLEVERGGVRTPLVGPPLAVLDQVLSSVQCEPGPIPLTGGFVGFFGYDLVRMIETLPNRPPDPFDLPVAMLGRFDHLVVFDHARQRVIAIANEIEGEVTARAASQALDALERLLTATEGGTRASKVPTLPADAGASASTGHASLDGPTFLAAVRQAQEHIKAGDIFQVVLARRFSVPRAPAPVALYRALRMVNPSPYMVLLEMPEATLVGASPEMLVRKVGTRVAMRPIAGTRPRSADPVADQALADELLADTKERAEHLMLVDLGRNDLGRIAAAGSVDVASFMQVERYSHVMHLVSSVEAELDDAHSGLDALLACFPAGTLSGAPKIRAMQIIDDLEPEARGPYGGAVGYFSYSGDVDTCITIRTLVGRTTPDGQGETSVTAGAGIVADSDPAAEQRETENKAAGVLAAVAMAERLERSDP